KERSAMDQSDRKARMRRFQFGDFQVRSAKYDYQDDNKHSGHRKPDRNATAVSRPEIINDPDNKDQPRGGEPRIFAGDTKVTYGSPPTQGCGDDKICHQSQSPRRREKPAWLARRRINPTD